MKFILLLSVLIAFLATLFVTPWMIRYLKNIGVEVKDQHKEGKPLIPVSGGMAVFFGIFFGVMFALFIETFYYGVSEWEIPLLAFTVSLFAITFVGFFDDMLIRKNKETSIGLRQWQKPLLTVVAAVPLMVINAGHSVITMPFFGAVDVGLLYPLLLVPIGVVGASNMVNLWAGFNGLEAGLGMIYLGNLGLYAWFVGEYVAALIAIISCAALLAFLVFNYSPAKIFPGDSLTYLLGGVLVSVAILGNIEKMALIVSIPFFIEFVLKMRGRLKKQSYGYWYKGRVKSFYKKIYSLPHIFTRTGKYTEREVVFLMYCIELFFCCLIWVI
jgi:UDP-N-acetylglucosamine--dolichyl-phosphate N-acetylglucosaminephosphotransferase